MTTALVSGMLLGLAASAHCAGMCGPLVLLVRRGFWIYHLGRLAIYALLALASGLIGSGIAAAGYSRVISIGAGAILLAAAAGAFHQTAPAIAAVWRPVTRAVAAVAPLRVKYGPAGAFLAGAINGLLPCGLVYAALTGAVAQGDQARSLALMVAFWAGTLPALAAVRVSGDRLRRLAFPRARYIMPLAIGLAGVVLVARGLWPAHDHRPVDHAAHVRSSR
jgi:uncharacterized protein